MGFKDQAVLLLTHPLEFRTLLQFWMYHRNNERDVSAQEHWASTGWDRPTMRRCWEFLDLTSRSFAAVVKELDGDLARTVALFYLVLRGLDTVEDDMTIPDDVKQPLLRSFHEKTVTPGWNFDGNGPDEKDRQLLVEYQVVSEELNLLDAESREIIVDICRGMENGMADYVHRASATGSIYLEAVADYDLYCHYVAGLVGEGCSRLFAATGKEGPGIARQLELSNNMGLFLQKTNIMRDVREDVDERRFFWPREIWGRADLGGFKEMAEMTRPENKENALWVLSAMVVDALRHVEESLDYLKLLKNQTVFNFCAIPQVMAIATLELVFMNPDVFQRNVKIRKAHAAELIMKATNPRDVAYLFRDYARKIHAKASPRDPNFMRVAVACGRVEQWCERQYPSHVKLQAGGAGGASIAYDATDARSKIVELEMKYDKEAALRAKALPPSTRALAEKNRVESDREAMYMMGVIALIVVVACLGIAAAATWVAGKYAYGD